MNGLALVPDRHAWLHDAEYHALVYAFFHWLSLAPREPALRRETWIDPSEDV